MKYLDWIRRIPTEAAWGASAAAGGLALLAGAHLAAGGLSPAGWAAGGGLSAAAGALTWGALRLREEKRQSGMMRERLETLVRLNRLYLEACDERQLLDSALHTLAESTGAVGVSYVPIDPWGQPLPSFSAGRLPEPVMRAWSEHLASEEVRRTCGACTGLYARPGQECPLHNGPLGDMLHVYCLPMRRGQRYLGLVNIYLPAERALSVDKRSFLDLAVNELALGVEAAHLRAQEVSTLRQIQRIGAPQGELQGLLDGIRPALDIQCAVLRFQKSPDQEGRQPDLSSGAASPEALKVFEQLVDQTLISGMPEQAGGWLTLPLQLADQMTLGVLGVMWRWPAENHARQQEMLEAVALRAAAALEAEEQISRSQFHAVIQERSRLAREIHDGLAQSLAFLKLRGAQMKTALNQRDLDRLESLMAENYQALSNAYLDTRQAIDNLRLNPDETFSGWINHILDDFEQSTGLALTRQLQPALREPALEIQSQLVRILQEALNNVRKHAEASSVRVSLREWSGDLILEVSDNGRGFDPEDVPEMSRHGLRGMRERAEWIGGDFQVISQILQGTTMRLRLPGALSFKEKRSE